MPDKHDHEVHQGMIDWASTHDYECTIEVEDSTDDLPQREIYRLRYRGNDHTRHTWLSWGACYAFLVGLSEGKVDMVDE